MTAIQLDLESIKLVVAQNIVAALSVDEKNSLLQQAVNALIAPSSRKKGYETVAGPSQLEDAFQIGVRKIAFEVVDQVLSDQSCRAMVVSAIRTKVEEAIKKESSWVFEAIGVCDFGESQHCFQGPLMRRISLEGWATFGFAYGIGLIFATLVSSNTFAISVGLLSILGAVLCRFFPGDEL